MNGWFQTRWLALAEILLIPSFAAAQIRLGDVTARSNGSISSGYTASYGNMTQSEHGWTFGGAADLSGSYYTPNFLSFNGDFYLNQSRANSNFQSISNASGLSVTSNIFSGSKFPGSVSYSKAYNSEGNYAVPGLANFVTHGNSDTFGINWNENLTGMPSLSASFQKGNSQYSVYGTNDNGKNMFHSLNLHSGYQLDGFSMGAYYTIGGSHSLIPEVVTSAVEETHASDSGYGFNLTHRLPLHGSASAAFNQSSWDSAYLGSRSTGTIDTVNANAAVHPIEKIALSLNANYSNNLTGQLVQSVLAAGGIAPLINSNETSNSLDLAAVASYAPKANMQTSAFFERRTQTFLGESFGVNSYGGSATFAHGLKGGTMNGAVTCTANTSDNTGEDTLGFSATENYSNVVLGWHVTESFGYSQNAQTLLVTYMNSFYNYSANARRNWGLFGVSAGAGGSRTALSAQAGTENSSESYNASAGYGAWITATGSYSKSSGQALATGAGLVPIPVPSPTLPSNLVNLFGGDSYSFGLSSSPVKKLILGAAYAKSISNTSGNFITSENQNNQFNSLVQYQLRKLSFTSGYSRLEQGFSGTGTKPEIISTYYAGVSRWFNFF